MLFSGLARAFLLSISIALLMPAAAQAQKLPDSREEITLSFAPLVKRSLPAVVNIYAKQMQRQSGLGPFSRDPFFRRFFEGDNFFRQRRRPRNSLGSGVIVRADGLIITNNHVIKDGTDIRVVLSDNREFSAKVLLSEERTDLAVLKVDTKGRVLPVLELGDSEGLEIGDLVLAIGNPFGIGQTVTSGIVSALARTRVGVSSYQFFIQTDAAINPGNSGGALIDMRGRLVGINTAIFSRSGGSNGIGFAIPSTVVDLVLSSIDRGGKVVRPWAGVGVQQVTKDLADSLGLGRPRGALITNLHPLSPLADAGLRRGDVVVRIGGKPIEQAREFGYRFANRPTGGSVGVVFLRGSLRRKARVELIAAPEVPPRNDTLIRGSTPFSGLNVANISPAVAEEMRLRTLTEGVVVTKVNRGAGRRVGFKPGDIIVDVNGLRIERVGDLQEAIQLSEGFWEIAVNRNGRVRRLRLGG